MYKNIIVPVDLDCEESLQTIISHVLTIAKKFKSKIHIVYVISDFARKWVEDFLPKDLIKNKKISYNNKGKKLIEKYIPDDIQAEFTLLDGVIYDEIINFSEEKEADLIALSAAKIRTDYLSTNGTKSRDYMLGPNASKIARHASTSVMIIRNIE